MPDVRLLQEDVMHEYYCNQCDMPLQNEGAESRGDGDIYDVWACPTHGRIYEVHADYCECGCGGGQVNDVFDSEYIPYDYDRDEIPRYE